MGAPPPPAAPRVLITGASGFVGGHLARLARANGATVVGVARRPGDCDIRADLTDGAAAAAAIRDVRPDRIFHLAAAASVAAAWSDPQAAMELNAAMGLNVLEAARREAPRARLLFACSGEAYGPVPAERQPVREHESFRPQNPYAVGKAWVDTLAGFYADAHELRVVRARAFNHSGPGQSDAYVIGAFARQIATAEAEGHTAVCVATGRTEPRRDFTDVRDVVRAYWLALERRERGAYNVCSGEATAVADILRGLARQTKLEVTHRVDPGRVRDNEVMEIRGSHDKLSAATGWQPQIPLERTLADTLEWWRAQLGR